MNSSLWSLFGRRRVRLVLSSFLLLVVFGHLLYLYMDVHGVMKPASGGSLREGAVGVVTGANPLFSQFNPLEDDIVRLVYSGLTKYDPKQKKIVPDLATWSVTNNNRTFTFFIQPNALWHDGKKITADDVIFTYGLLETEKFSNAYLKQMFAGTSVEKKDETTVIFTLPDSFSNFPTQTTLGILPKHIWEKVAPEDIELSTLNQHPMGSGPFKVEGSLLQSQSAAEDKVVTLVRFDDYFGDKSYLDKIVFDIFPTFESLYEKRNSLESVRLVDYEYLQKFKEIERFDVLSYPASKYYALFFNTESQALQHWRTRLGLKLALNKDTLLASYQERLERIDTPFLTTEDDHWLTTPGMDKAQGALFDGGWKFIKEEEIQSYFSPEAPLSTPAVNRGTVTGEMTSLPVHSNANVASTDKPINSNVMIPGSTSPIPVSPKENSNTSSSSNTNTNTASPTPPVVEKKPSTESSFSAALKKYPRSLQGIEKENALRELKKSRFNDQGQPCLLRFVTLSSPAYLGQIAEEVKKQWESLGCSVDLTRENSRDILEIIQNRSYDIIFIGQELGYDQDIFASFHSSQVTKKGYNLSNFKNKKMDAAIEALRNIPSELSYDEVISYRNKQMKAVSTIFRDEIPAVMLFKPKSYMAVEKKFKDVEIGMPTYPKDRFFFITKWYLSEQKAWTERLSPGAFLKWVGQYFTL